MKTLTLAALCALLFTQTGCMFRTARQLPAIIEALAKDTNTVYLRVTSPTFGTLEFQRNMPVDIKSGKGGL